MEASFVLIKPDKVNDGMFEKELLKHLLSRDIFIENRIEFSLRPYEVEFLWPKFATRYLRLSLNLLKCYLCSRHCNILFIKGHNLIEQSKQIKSILRSKYSNGPYSNCIHTPSNHIELEVQSNYFRTKILTYFEEGNKTQFNLLGSRRTMGLWGRLNEMSGSTLYRICKDVVENTRPYVHDSYNLDGDYALVLYKNKQNKDYVASCLFELCSDLTIVQAITAVIEIIKSGYVILFTGKERELIANRNILNKFEVRSVVIHLLDFSVLQKKYESFINKKARLFLF